jgi:hypothetical protein
MLSASAADNFFSGRRAVANEAHLRALSRGNRHHAPHKSSRISIVSSAFGAFYPGHDLRVVVSDAHR